MGEMENRGARAEKKVILLSPVPRFELSSVSASPALPLSESFVLSRGALPPTSHGHGAWLQPRSPRHRACGRALATVHSE